MADFSRFLSENRLEAPMSMLNHPSSSYSDHMVLPFQPPNNSQQAILSSEMLSSAAANRNPNGTISVELENADLWRKFHQHTTEMIVNKTGRRMFPTLKFRVSGLEPSTSYAVFLEIAPADECRYKYQSGRWVINGRADPLPQSAPGSRTRLYPHPDSPAPGHLWTRQPISFHRIKLTNNILDPQGNTLLNSMHKYQPRLLIMKLQDFFPGVPQLVGCGSFPESAFLTVTAYQNNSIIQLKIDHNPFAKGFREHTHRKRPHTPQTNSPEKRQRRDEMTEKNPSDDDSKDEQNSVSETESKKGVSVSDSESNAGSSPLSVSRLLHSPRSSSFTPVKPMAFLPSASPLYPLRPPFSPFLPPSTPLAPLLYPFHLNTPQMMSLGMGRTGIFGQPPGLIHPSQAEILLAAAMGLQGKHHLPGIFQ